MHFVHLQTQGHVLWWSDVTIYTPQTLRHAAKQLLPGFDWSTI